MYPSIAESKIGHLICRIKQVLEQKLQDIDLPNTNQDNLSQMFDVAYTKRQLASLVRALHLTTTLLSFFDQGRSLNLFDLAKLASIVHELMPLLANFQTTDSASPALTSMIQQFELKIVHPCMFDCAIEALLVLEQLPQSLNDLLPFLNPAALSIPTVISYQKPNHDTSVTASYMYQINKENYDFYDLYQQYLPLLKTTLLLSVSDYFTHYSEITLVKNQQNKSLLIIDWLVEQTKDIPTLMKDLHITSLPLLSMFMNQDGLLSDQLNGLQLLHNKLIDIEKKVTDFLQSLPLKKNNYLYAAEKLYSETIIFIKNNDDLDGQSVRQYIEQFFNYYQQDSDDLLQLISTHKSTIDNQIEKVYKAWYKQEINQHQFQNQMLEQALYGFSPPNTDNTIIDIKNMDLTTKIQNTAKQLNSITGQLQRLAEQEHALATFEMTVLELKNNRAIPAKLVAYCSDIVLDIAHCYSSSQQLYNTIKQQHAQRLKTYKHQKCELSNLLIRLTDEKNNLEALYSISPALFHDVLSAKLLSLAQLSQSFDANNYQCLQIEHDEAVTNLSLIEQHLAVKKQDELACLNEFNDYALQAFEKMAFVQPVRKYINYPRVDSTRTVSVIECLQALVNRFDTQLEKGQLSLLKQVQTCLAQPASTFSHIRQLACIKALPQSTDAIVFLFQLVGADSLEETNTHLAMFQALLVAKIEILNAAMIDIIVDHYRQERTAILELIDCLATLKDEIDAHHDDYQQLLRQQTLLLEHVAGLKKTLNYMADMQQSILAYQEEIALLDKLYRLLVEKSNLDNNLIAFIHEHNDGLTIEQLYKRYDTVLTVCADSVTIFDHYNHELNILAQSNTVVKLPLYQAKITQITNTISLTKQQLNQFLLSYRTRLIDDATQDSDLIMATGAALRQQIAHVHRLSSDELALIVKSYDAFNQLLHNFKAKSLLNRTFFTDVIIALPIITRWQAVADEINAGLMKQVGLRRNEMVNWFINQLQDYLYCRANRYWFKDFFTNSDQQERASFIATVQEQLVVFDNTGKCEELLAYLHLKNKIFPGHYLQPLLNRLALTLNHYQTTIATPADTPVMAHDFESCLRLLRDKKPNFVAPLCILCDKIKSMRVYGEKMVAKNNMSCQSLGQQAMDLAFNLEKKLQHYVTTSYLDIINNHRAVNQNYARFKQAFSLCLHSQDDKMNMHRASWKPLIANIVVAMTTLGVATGMQLITSKLGQAQQATFFFHDTTRMKHIVMIDHALAGMNVNI